ncbi:MAG: fasciclin domain-containing protein [Planctomycetota bacterium]
MKSLITTISAIGLAGAAFGQCGSVPSACGSDSKMTTASTVAYAEPTKNIVETAAEAGTFQTLLAAAGAADLADTLATGGPFTVFAPTDEAFAALPAGTVESLLKPENKGTLQAILLYHVVEGNVLASDVASLDAADTLNGQRVAIDAGSGGVKVDGANVVATDIRATNGTIHVIDRVILPSTDTVVETAVKAGSFGTLAAALQAAGLVGALNGEGPFTVFAPTDEAFAKLPAGTVESLLQPQNLSQLKDILKLHVVSGRVYADQVAGIGSAESLGGGTLTFSVDGGQASVNGADIVTTDIDTANGVIHVIDSVILPE